MMLALCSGCGPAQPPPPTNYDDCILQKVGKGQTKGAAQAVIAACRSKFKTASNNGPWLKYQRADDSAAQAAADAAAAAADAAAFAVAAAPSKDAWYESAPLAEPATFHGYECTDDCSGHEAGYEWAEEQGITDPDDCGGNSPSFVEGCRAWADENG